MSRSVPTKVYFDKLVTAILANKLNNTRVVGRQTQTNEQKSDYKEALGALAARDKTGKLAKYIGKPPKDFFNEYKGIQAIRKVAGIDKGLTPRKAANKGGNGNLGSSIIANLKNVKQLSAALKQINDSKTTVQLIGQPNNNVVQIGSAFLSGPIKGYTSGPPPTTTTTTTTSTSPPTTTTTTTTSTNPPTSSSSSSSSNPAAGYQQPAAVPLPAAIPLPFTQLPAPAAGNPLDEAALLYSRLGLFNNPNYGLPPVPPGGPAPGAPPAPPPPGGAAPGAPPAPAPGAPAPIAGAYPALPPGYFNVLTAQQRQRDAAVAANQTARLKRIALQNAANEISKENTTLAQKKKKEGSLRQSFQRKERQAKADPSDRKKQTAATKAQQDLQKATQEVKATETKIQSLQAALPTVQQELKQAITQLGVEEGKVIREAKGNLQYLLQDSEEKENVIADFFTATAAANPANLPRMYNLLSDDYKFSVSGGVRPGDRYLSQVPNLDSKIQAPYLPNYTVGAAVGYTAQGPLSVTGFNLFGPAPQPGTYIPPKDGVGAPADLTPEERAAVGITGLAPDYGPDYKPYYPKKRRKFSAETNSQLAPIMQQMLGTGYNQGYIVNGGHTYFNHER